MNIKKLRKIDPRCVWCLRYTVIHTKKQIARNNYKLPKDQATRDHIRLNGNGNNIDAEIVLACHECNSHRHNQIWIRRY